MRSGVKIKRLMKHIITISLQHGCSKVLPVVWNVRRVEGNVLITRIPDEVYVCDPRAPSHAKL
jgi:hypothetical protein